jgi:hypothetical protein
VIAPRELLVDPNTQILDFRFQDRTWLKSVKIDTVVLCLLFDKNIALLLRELIVIGHLSNHTSTRRHTFARVLKIKKEI